MRKYYFKSSDPQGNIFIQMRYYMPYDSDKCYEAVIISISQTNVIRQFTDNFNEVDLTHFEQTLQTSSETEFNSIQELNTLGGTGKRKNAYDTFYNQWKDYFLAKRKSLEAVRGSSTTTNWNYYDRLENEWQINGIYDKREQLKQLEETIKHQNNISLSDIYKEARHNATLDYVANRI